MGIATTTETLGGGDYRWLASARGTDHPRSGTLDIALFTEGTHYPDGYVPSGTQVSYIEATGRYGPFTGGVADVNEVQTLSRTSTGGTVILTFGGQTTGTIPASAAGFTAAVVQAALVALSNIGADDVTVTGSAGGPLTVTFTGDLASTNVGAITVDNTSATGGTVTVAQTTAGAAGLDGFVWHDKTVRGALEPTALLTDATILAEFLPTNPGGLVDGRYLCDTPEEA